MTPRAELILTTMRSHCLDYPHIADSTMVSAALAIDALIERPAILDRLNAVVLWFFALWRSQAA